MSKTKTFAELELDILTASSTDPENRPIIEEFREEILALCEKFGNSGQSGGSAPYVAGALSSAIGKLLLFKPICPIMGIDDEWSDVRELCDPNDTDKMYWQNKRLSSLFKNQDGSAYYLDAIVWNADTEGESGNNWDNFTGYVEGIGSRQFVKFPFEPKTFHIAVTKEILPQDHNVEPFFQWDYKDKDGKRCTEKYRYIIKDKSQLDDVWEYYVKPSSVS